MSEQNLAILQPVVAMIASGFFTAGVKWWHLKRFEEKYTGDGKENAWQMRVQEQQRIEKVEASMPTRNFVGLLFPCLVLGVAGNYATYAVWAAWIIAIFMTLISLLPIFDFRNRRDAVPKSLDFVFFLFCLAFVPALLVLTFEMVRVIFL